MNQAAQPSSATLPSTTLSQLRRFDTPTVSNAIERFDLRPRNEGFVQGTLRGFFPDLPPVVGYAVTATIRTSSQPVVGGYYHDHFGFWSHVATQPSPRVLVIEDVDGTPCFGAFIGAMHATIAKRLDCLGCLTNGAVRDLAAVEALGFQLFANAVSPSHAYAHIVSFGGPVTIGHHKILPGDLLHGDRHGVVTIPLGIAAEISGIVDQIEREEQQIIRLCASSRFSLPRLAALLETLRTDVPRWAPKTEASDGTIQPDRTVEGVVRLRK